MDRSVKSLNYFARVPTLPQFFMEGSRYAAVILCDPIQYNLEISGRIVAVRAYVLKIQFKKTTVNNCVAIHA